uniref:Uncharacterized protein n=1 Tax=Anguilla anguilla TaxID=7936 RepID=A0A0E9WXV9_ANGAN
MGENWTNILYFYSLYEILLNVSQLMLILKCILKIIYTAPSFCINLHTHHDHLYCFGL